MKKKAVFLALLVSLTALCACNGGSSGEKGSEDEFSAVVGITQDLDSLDPHKAVAAGTDEVLFNVFEGLVKPSADGTLVPAVAKEYTIAPDGMSYTFTLRENVKFHNGKVVTADDVVYSIKRCAGLLDNQDPEVVVESALSVISAVEKVGEDTVVLTLSEPNTELLGFLTCFIIPEDYDKQESAPVGTGPFQFVSYTPLTSFVIERFDDYYGEKPYLEKVTFKICASTDAAFMELLSGGIDIFPYLTDEQASQLPEDYSLEVGASNLVQAMFLNNDFEPFADVRVRQALCYAVDKEEMMNIVSGGRGHAIGSNMFPNFGVYYEASLENYYTYQPEKAKELLADAGYDESNPLSFVMKVPSNYDFHVATAQVLAEQYKEIGVEVELQLIEWSAWLTDVYRSREYEATIVGLDSALAPSDVLKRYSSTASNNFVNYKSAEFDDLFTRALASVDEDEKVALYKEIQTLLTEEAASVYLQDAAKLVAVNKRFTNFLFYPVYVLDMASIQPAQ
ncbi:MAG: ABC transporter substrate-binding protein [Lachnospiraceae bacterium]|nr:ABC transporter substrate-binding protein [Lachnospiraceae bacterium]